jgi:8-oxo-dGTP diphosphatase
MKNFDHAVKAIIYNDSKEILLQQRDYTEGIPFQGHWTFFGGKVEDDNSFIQALERELMEELNCIPGKIEPELFSSVWNGGEIPTINHYFPIQLQVDANLLNLNEGFGMDWFAIENIKLLEKLVPSVKENLYHLENYFQGKLLTHE